MVLIRVPRRNPDSIRMENIPWLEMQHTTYNRNAKRNQLSYLLNCTGLRNNYIM